MQSYILTYSRLEGGNLQIAPSAFLAEGVLNFYVCGTPIHGDDGDDDDDNDDD